MNVALDPTGSGQQLVSDARHDRMARDSLVLTASYGLSAVVGVAFWTLAARTVPAERLGIDTAVISAITASGAIAATGVSNAFLAMLPVADMSRRSLLRLGYLVVGVASLVFGLIAGVLTVTLLPGMHPSLLSIGGVTFAAVVWSWFVLQDSVLAGLGRVTWLLAENIPVNLVKLGLLPVFSVLVGTGGNPVVYAALVPATVAVVIVTGFVIPYALRASEPPTSAQPATAAVPTGHGTTDPTDPQTAAWLSVHRGAFAGFAVRDGAASALNLGLFMILPFVVTAVSGPVQGAVFALCLQVSAAMDMFTAGVGVSLTTNVAADPSHAFDAARRMWVRLFKIVAVAAVGLIAGAPVLLWVFGRTYLDHHGWAIIIVLAAGSLMRTTFEVWTALLRALRHTGVLLVWTVAASILLLTLVIVFAHFWGALGAAVGVTASTGLTALIGAFGLSRNYPSVERPGAWPGATRSASAVHTP